MARYNITIVDEGVVVERELLVFSHELPKKFGNIKTTDLPKSVGSTRQIPDERPWRVINISRED